MSRLKAITKYLIISLGLSSFVLSLFIFGHSFSFAYIVNYAASVQGSTIYRHIDYQPQPEYPTWDKNTRYFAGDVIYYNGVYYFASLRFSGSGEVGLRPDLNCGAYEKWEIKKDLPIKEWNSAIVYKQGDVVLYNGEYYQAKFYSYNDLPTQVSEFSPWHKLVNTWNANQAYCPYSPNLEEEVIYNGRRYRANYWNMGRQPDQNYGYDGSGKEWEIIRNVIEVSWQEHIRFGAGDIVVYNGDYYMANKLTINQRPNQNGDAWTLLEDTWRQNKNYSKNDTVMYKGVLYKARQDNCGLRPDINYGSNKAWEIVYYFN